MHRWCDHSLCEGEVLPSAEICDGVDNDCDGLVDDDDLLDTSTYNIYYLDSDGDGYGTLVTKGKCLHTSGPMSGMPSTVTTTMQPFTRERQSFAMGRLTIVLLALFQPMRVMTMVMALSSAPSMPVVGTVHWRKRVVTVTMEMHPSFRDKVGIRTVIPDGYSNLTVKADNLFASGRLRYQCRRLRRWKYECQLGRDRGLRRGRYRRTCHGLADDDATVSLGSKSTYYYDEDGDGYGGETTQTLRPDGRMSLLGATVTRRRRSQSVDHVVC